MIEVSDLDFGYASPDGLFRGFGWSVARGETWAVLGPSGCGKSTLLHLLAGLRRPSGGSIRVDGTPIDGVRRSTGLILQDHGLLPWATAFDNAALGLRLRGVAAGERRTRVDRWLDRLGVADLRDRYPWQLSGGQRQRVAIARALVLEPDLLLMDEPFASLDALTREDLQESLVDLTVRDGGPTVVLVTHDVAEAAFVARRILVLPRPPIAGAAIVDNPLAGSAGLRERPEYLSVCAAVRSLVGRARGGQMVGVTETNRQAAAAGGSPIAAEPEAAR